MNDEASEMLEATADVAADETADVAADEVVAESAQAEAAAEPQEPGELSVQQLEALLFVAERPLSRDQIAAVARVDRETVDERLGDLEMALTGRGIRLVLSGDDVELATAPESGALVARYLGIAPSRLSPALLETLAIVAYRQPVTKAAIERIRGVDSDHALRTLLHRRLIVEMGRADTPGRPILYGTGFTFLERFGMASIEELPVLDALAAERLVDPLEEAAPTSAEAESAAEPAEPAEENA